MPTHKQALESALAKSKQMAKIVYVDEGHIVIDTVVLCNASTTYDISLDRCSSPQQILAWVSHLLDKSWMTMDVLDCFIAIAADEAGVELHPL